MKLKGAKIKRKRSVKTWKFPSNFMYVGGVNYDYDTHQPCDDGCANDYCRCGVITNIRIKIDFQHLAMGLAMPMESISLEESEAIKLKRTVEKNCQFFDYSIDRILRLKKADNPDCWSGCASSGYYGQEMSGIHFTCHETSNLIQNFYKLSPNDKIIELLKLEYGHLLPELETMKWSLETANIKDLVIPNLEYMRKIDSSTYPNMEEYGLPIGIYLEAENGRYKLVDGYHRLVSAQRTKKRTKFPIIVGKKK